MPYPLRALSITNPGENLYVVGIPPHDAPPILSEPEDLAFCEVHTDTPQFNTPASPPAPGGG